jgi:membrane carboxypeptidase/penicillin-binding protein PbpC
MKNKIAIIIGITFLIFIGWVFFPVIFSEDSTENIQYSNTVFLDTNGKVFYTLPKDSLSYHTPLSPKKIDINFLFLLTKKEDENFYSHYGVDVPKKVYLLGKYILGYSHRGG